MNLHTKILKYLQQAYTLILLSMKGDDRLDKQRGVIMALMGMKGGFKGPGEAPTCK